MGLSSSNEKSSHTSPQSGMVSWQCQLDASDKRHHRLYVSLYDEPWMTCVMMLAILSSWATGQDMCLMTCVMMLAILSSWATGQGLHVERKTRTLVRRSRRANRDCVPTAASCTPMVFVLALNYRGTASLKRWAASAHSGVPCSLC